jgi:hypothetical protein
VHRRRPALALVPLLVAGGLAGSAATTSSPASAATGCAAQAPLTWEEPKYVDTTRAGGEPLVATHPSGRLMYSSHAGTTHFYSPEAAATGSTAFVENYEGQTYIWTSDDLGETWQFRDRDGLTSGVGSGAPASGFSDPEFAIDSEGGLYFSEINLANIAVSSSNDKGDTWALKNFFGAVLTDRQWMEADRPNELYFVANAFGGGTGTPLSPGTGHFISKSTDGGATFTTNIPNPGGLGDIRVDKRNGTVYEAHFAGGNLSVAAFRNARSGDLTKTDDNVVAEGVQLISSFAAIEVDPSGNVYITWDERGSDEYEGGIYYAYSKDEGKTWSKPYKVDDGKGTAIWPWLGVGDDGKAAIAWLQADTPLPNNDGETAGEHGWRIVGAVTTSGLGCTGSADPVFSRSVATPDPVHTGTICQSGTTCQATATDRRLGDYISLDVDNTGRMYVGYSDTQQDGAVSLPGFVRQAGGPLLVGGTTTPPVDNPPVAQPPATPPATGGLPATGPEATLPAAGALALLGLFLAARRRRA